MRDLSCSLQSDEADAFGVMAAYNKVTADGARKMTCCSTKSFAMSGDLPAWLFPTGADPQHGGCTKNGLNVEMPDKRFFGQALLDAVKSDWFLKTSSIGGPRNSEGQAGNQAGSRGRRQQGNHFSHRTAANGIQGCIKSIVLLKNDGALPLQLKGKPRIAVIGANTVQTMATGGWAQASRRCEVTLLEGLRTGSGDGPKSSLPKDTTAAPGLGSPQKEIAGRKEKENREGSRLLKLAKEAVAAAKDIVLYWWNNRQVETEGRVDDISLPFGQTT